MEMEGAGLGKMGPFSSHTVGGGEQEGGGALQDDFSNWKRLYLTQASLLLLKSPETLNTLPKGTQ